MSALGPVIVGSVLGMAVGALLVPLTQRALGAATARAAAGEASGLSGETLTLAPEVEPRVGRGQWVALAVASGLLPAYVLYRVGWSLNAIPPLLMFVGLVQLAYCDLTRRLLPKPLVHALSGVVVASGIMVVGFMNDWHHLLVATLGGVATFALFFVINLANPSWMAYGDVRLSFVLGFGLAWVSPFALVEGFFIANLLAAVVGVALIAAHRAGRHSAVPFGLYLALGTALVLVTWS